MSGKSETHANLLRRIQKVEAARDAAVRRGVIYIGWRNQQKARADHFKEALEAVVDADSLADAYGIAREALTWKAKA